MDIKSVLGEISIFAVSLSEEANSIDEFSRHLKIMAGDQAASINDIVSAMDEINNQATDNKAHAEKADTLSNEGKRSSQSGVVQMKQVHNAILKISETSNSISLIIKSIDDIAFQTNLLALNAAIESSKAGKHGKGFAVVAQEVRQLAIKSAEATGETSGLIEALLEKVNTGSTTSNKTVSELDIIHDDIETMTSLVKNITEYSREQNRFISEMNKRMGDVLNITQQTAGNAKETSVSASTLNQTAEQIQHLIQAFDSGI